MLVKLIINAILECKELICNKVINMLINKVIEEVLVKFLMMITMVLTGNLQNHLNFKKKNKLLKNPKSNSIN